MCFQAFLPVAFSSVEGLAVKKVGARQGVDRFSLDSQGDICSCGWVRTQHSIWGQKFLVLEGNRLECHPWQPCVRAGCNQPCTVAQGEIINYCPKLATLSPPWLQHTQTVLRPKPSLRLFWANLNKSFCSFLHCLPQGLSSVVALSQSYIQAPWKTWATKGLGMVQEKFVLHRFQSVLKGLYMQMDFILGWGKSCWVCKQGRK